MACRRDDIATPSTSLLALESRGMFSLAPLIAACPFWRRRGAPHPLIVVPDLGATDRSNLAIRHWNRGRNNRPA